MENNSQEVKKRSFTNKKLLLYTLLPAVILIIIVSLLIPYYETSYNLTSREHLEIWVSIRNLFNVFMIAIFIVGIINIFIKSKRSEKHISYLSFIIHWFIALSLMNFSFTAVEVIKVSIDSLPKGIGFEQLKK